MSRQEKEKREENIIEGKAEVEREFKRNFIRLSDADYDEFIEKIHTDGKLLWVNSIIFNHRQQLAGGHSDDTALSGDMEKGWGWLADRGFDVIQTDYTYQCNDYLIKNGRRK